jgi:hypothetical protein
MKIFELVIALLAFILFFMGTVAERNDKELQKVMIAGMAVAGFAFAAIAIIT